MPVSEYVEKTGANTMTFLSYPKYFTNTEGVLEEADTTLVTSDEPEWRRVGSKIFCFSRKT